MKKLIKRFANYFDDSFFRQIVKFTYPQYKRPRLGYRKNYQILYDYFFFQKIIGFNRSVPWPVNRTSTIIDWQNISKGILCDPGDNPGIFINASGGLQLGYNVNIGPNTVIVTSNHNKYDHRKVTTVMGVTIGNNVWVGANCTIVAGVTIGDEVTIGAGCVITRDIPAKCTVTINSEVSLIIKSKSGGYEWDCTKEELL
jgi:acetyltransferase-like isoleucine patch superfamily enzyme